MKGGKGPPGVGELRGIQNTNRGSGPRGPGGAIWHPRNEWARDPPPKEIEPWTTPSRNRVGKK